MAKTQEWDETCNCCKSSGMIKRKPCSDEVSIKVKKKQEKWPIHSNKLSGIYYHRTETWEVSQLRSNPPAVHYKKETRSREQETAPQNPPQHPKLVWRQQFWSPPVWKWKRQKRTATKLQKALQPRDEVRLPALKGDTTHVYLITPSIRYERQNFHYVSKTRTCRHRMKLTWHF